MAMERRLQTFVSQLGFAISSNFTWNSLVHSTVKCAPKGLLSSPKPVCFTYFLMYIRIPTPSFPRVLLLSGTLFLLGKHLSKATRLINNPNLIKSPQSLSHRRLAVDLSIFYRYFNRHCSQEISEVIPAPGRRVRTTRSSTHSHPFQTPQLNPRNPPNKSSFIPRTCNLWIV